ncbi:MAG: hypothetical protein COB84_02935 [Rhodobacteraceae bacterium]|nr:MAG: hypothetical protein COB84_02935 [Paracoccaceae bacterium]
MGTQTSRSWFYYVFIICFLYFDFPTYSMTFTTELSPANFKGTIVVGKGSIERGDAIRFEAAINAHPPSSNILMVTSLGGSVDEAMKLAGRIKTNSFSVIVHQECASACAQILFPAGKYSILTKGSMLGIHSCSISGKRHETCNEDIAKYAVLNGFPYGTLDYFSEMYGPGDMKWMTEISARCFGFYRGYDDPKPINGGRKACVDGVIFSMGSNVHFRPFGPSFDCRKATTRVERLFCIDKELMQSDKVLGFVYDTKLDATNIQEEEKLRSNQRQWINARNIDCRRLFTENMDFISTRDVALCLYSYNEDRIYELIDNSLLMPH